MNINLVVQLEFVFNYHFRAADSIISRYSSCQTSSDLFWDICFNLTNYSSCVLGCQNNNLFVNPVMISLYSGEKIPDVNWSEFVEVKGKVKLEAFEKYIKDLPRSRNRGLMVSYCYFYISRIT